MALMRQRTKDRPRPQSISLDPALSKKPSEQLVIGWREWLSLPELGVRAIKAKIDTGARTSALHAWNIKPFYESNVLYVRFMLHPLQRDNTKSIRCKARVRDERVVKNSGGVREFRYVIETPIKLGGFLLPIELTLTNRDEMGFRMLLGRTALPKNTIIFPRKSFMMGKRKPVAKTKIAKSRNKRKAKEKNS